MPSKLDMGEMIVVQGLLDVADTKMEAAMKTVGM